MREGRGLLAAPVAADPDVAFVVDVDTVIRRWPIVTLARPSPVSDEIARLIELKDWWRRCTAFRRFGFQVAYCSLASSEPARCMIHTLSFPSTATPITAPITQ